MIINTDYKFNFNTIEKLKTILGKPIHHILANSSYYHEKENSFFFKNVRIPFWNSSQIQSLTINSYYVFKEHIGDEVKNLFFTFGDNNLYMKSYQILHFKPPFVYHLQEPFIPSVIRIYGQSRTRKWSEEKKYAYFGEKIINEVNDYLYTNEYLILESNNKLQLVFWVEQNTIGFKITNNFQENFTNLFYRKEDLNLSHEVLSSNDNYTTQPILKLHQEIKK